MADLNDSLHAAVDIQPGAAGNQRYNLPCSGAGGLNVDLGALTSVKCLSPKAFGDRVTIAQLRAAPANPTIDLMARQLVGRWLEELNCSFGMYIRQACAGVHADVSNYDQLWYIGQAYITAKNSDPLADIGGEATEVNDTMPTEGTYAMPIMKLKAERLLGSVATLDTALNDIIIFNKYECGICNLYPRWVAVGDDQGAGYAPGYNPIMVLYDGNRRGLKYMVTEVTGLTGDATFVFQVGNKIFVGSHDANMLAYHDWDDLWAGTGSWTLITGQFETGGEPNACYVYANTVFIASDGGYIYKSIGGYTYEQVSAGEATTENLLSIDGYDGDDVVASGENGVYVITSNGGNTWTAGTFMAGVDGNVVKMPRKNYIYIGGSDGTLYWTSDLFKEIVATNLGLGTGAIADLVFANSPLSTDGPVALVLMQLASGISKIARSIDGGFAFDEPISLPAAITGQLNAIDAYDQNTFVAVGELAADAIAEVIGMVRNG